MTSVYISMIICVTDPPPATAKLLTDQLVKERIEKYLNEEKYTQTLKLVVEAMDEEKLRVAEEKRSKRAEYVSPKVTEKSGGKAKKKSM